MALALTWAAVPGLLAAAAHVAMAAGVFLARPDRRQNRWLAAYFFAFGLFAAAYGLGRAATDPVHAWALHVAGTPPVAWSLGAYVLFLATLPTPLAAPLRGRAAQAVVVAGVLALTGAMLWDPLAWQPGVAPTPEGAWENLPGPAWGAMNSLAVVVNLAAIGIAVSAYRRARSDVVRRQLGCYVVGFVVYDAVLVASLLLITSGIPFTGTPFFGTWFLWVVALSSLWLLAWLSYGVLRYQLFDIDLRLKRTVRQGTLVAFFLAAFFVVSELTAAVLSEVVGTVVGVLAAGALLFFLAPLERAAQRVSDRTMPHVRDTEEYRVVRRREVYRAAVESALQDGLLTEKERDVLATLQEQLGLRATEALDIERQARAAAPERAG